MKTFTGKRSQSKGKKTMWKGWKINSNIWFTSNITIPHRQCIVVLLIAKINTYNLIFPSSPSNDVSCYVWHEREAKRDANKISYSVWYFLSDFNSKVVKDNETIDIINFYRVNWSRQNKDRLLFALYQYALNNLRNVKVITHKYLIRDHTQNEADGVHSAIGW